MTKNKTSDYLRRCLMPSAVLSSVSSPRTSPDVVSASETPLSFTSRPPIGAGLLCLAFLFFQSGPVFAATFAISGFEPPLQRDKVGIFTLADCLEQGRLSSKRLGIPGIKNAFGQGFEALQEQLFAREPKALKALESKRRALGTSIVRAHRKGEPIDMVMHSWGCTLGLRLAQDLNQTTQPGWYGSAEPWAPVPIRRFVCVDRIELAYPMAVRPQESNGAPLLTSNVQEFVGVTQQVDPCPIGLCGEPVTLEDPLNQEHRQLDLDPNSLDPTVINLLNAMNAEYNNTGGVSRWGAWHQFLPHSRTLWNWLSDELQTPCSVCGNGELELDEICDGELFSAQSQSVCSACIPKGKPDECTCECPVSGSFIFGIGGSQWRGSPLTVAAKAPATGLLDLSIRGTWCYTDSLGGGCVSGTSDYEYSPIDPPVHSTAFGVNGVHVSPTNGATTPSPTSSYGIELPISAGEPIRFTFPETGIFMITDDISGRFSIECSEP
jgi:hypothetical protein